MSHVYCEVNENMEQIFIISIISCQVPSVLFICDVKYLFEVFFYFDSESRHPHICNWNLTKIRCIY